MKVVVTTGTFGYSALVKAFLDSLSDLSTVCSHLEIQYGQDGEEFLDPLSLLEFKGIEGIKIRLVKYYSSIESFVEDADVVVTHAGTGTVLELAGLNKTFVVVPNPLLKNSHQMEFSKFLKENGMCVSSPDRVVQDIIRKNYAQKSVRVTEDLWDIIAQRLDVAL